ncbi:IpaD/SipD/SspD family type III secretion system needle tip protein [Pantoea sp. Acro-807]|uniref:IpaD/SipD/SspD family type III secretion system needle tip protein n=1 Tax=Pantoea sp. Acro-807 TaxID=2608356 RepID=UPI00141A1A3C|nr:IpaD/SipD/SspD family type III secretion system needle tip protein [Pantoea sp. Acro-807]NIE72333.1 IpaD/SipD/SspD family type III secretion system needle tip protein [Pantoea sp. Acro-807]
MLSTSLSYTQFEPLHFKKSNSDDTQPAAEKQAKAEVTVNITSTPDKEDARHVVTVAENNQLSSIKQAEQHNNKLVNVMRKNQEISHQIKVLQANTHACHSDAELLKNSAEKIRGLLIPLSREEMLNIQQQACEVAGGNTRQRNINQLMADFYHPSIQQDSPEEIQERFDLLRFETDLVSLNADDNSWGRDLAQKHWEAIGATRDNYLEVFLKSFEKLNSFFSEFASFRSKIHLYIGSPDKDGKMNFEYGKFRGDLRPLWEKYEYPNISGHLFPDTNKTASKEECERWIRQMGLPAGYLKGDDLKGYSVHIDTSILESMYQQVPFGSLTATELANWQSGFEAQSEDLQKTMQTFTQKMTSANSLYDNLVKIFSSFIEQDLGAAKGYLNF